MRVLIAFILFELAAACGVAKPDYVPYEQKKGTGGTGTSTATETETAADCAGGLATFATNVSPAVESSCGAAGCHKTGAGSVTLAPGTDAANRKSLLAYTGTTGDKLMTKLASAGHPGGSSAKIALTDAAITAWMNDEAKCP